MKWFCHTYVLSVHRTVREMFTQLNILWTTKCIILIACYDTAIKKHDVDSVRSNFASSECALWLCQFSTQTRIVSQNCLWSWESLHLYNTDTWNWNAKNSKTKTATYKITTTFIVLIYELVTFIGTHFGVHFFK